MHLTSCTAGETLADKRNFCEVCFPAGSMSTEVLRDAAVRRFREVPLTKGGTNSGKNRDYR